MAIENIYYLVGGIALGVMSTIIINKYRMIVNDISILADKIVETRESILSPDEMAKRVINAKIPLSELTPEMYDNVKAEAEKVLAKSASAGSMNYLG